MSHFRLHLPDTGRDIYMPRKSQSWGYRYGPSIMVHDGICEAWFASPGDSFEADWFTYRRSYDNGMTWTEERVVMSPVPDSMDWFSVCDPAVIKYGDYYYMGYTSTVFANGGGVCNNGFIARSQSPTGPFERWCGTGWGESRVLSDGTVCHWNGKPAPVIYFDEYWRNWGAGEFSFVIKDDLLYIYYTWTSKNLDGWFSQTRVATADITCENWPATITQRGVASWRTSGRNDSYDVVFCEDLQKFIALSTDGRFSEGSYLAVYESDDGLSFERVNQIKVHTGWMLHNCGISGNCHHHIRTGDTMLLAYAYGNKWGCWGTRIHDYTFSIMDDAFYDETALDNVHHEIEKLDDPPVYTPTMLYLEKPHFMRIRVGQEAEMPMMMGNVAYDMKPAGDGICFANYDTNTVSIEGGIAKGLKAGYTYVTASRDGLLCEFLIYVTEGDPDAFCPWQPYPEKAVTSFVPLISAYHASLFRREKKHVRGLATYADSSWFEICGEDGVHYENHSPDLFSIDLSGNVIPNGNKTGKGSITLSIGGHSFTVDFFVDP